MTITINLAPDLAACLLRIAVVQGQTVEVVAEALLWTSLRKQNIAEEGGQETTLTDLFEGRTGVCNSYGKFNYSEDTGNAFTNLLITKRKVGNL